MGSMGIARIDRGIQEELHGPGFRPRLAPAGIGWEVRRVISGVRRVLLPSARPIFGVERTRERGDTTPKAGRWPAGGGSGETRFD